jgi:hypothetical protein
MITIFTPLGDGHIVETQMHETETYSRQSHNGRVYAETRSEELPASQFQSDFWFRFGLHMQMGGGRP